MKAASVAIIGAGPAGLAAAIQLKRYGLEPLLLEGDRVGGLLLNANLVENYPGFPGGISGPALVKLFEQQARFTGVEVTQTHVISLYHTQDGFEIKTLDQEYQSDVLVIAAGTKPRLLTDIHIPISLVDRVYYSVFPILRIENKQIAIIGAGDAAFDYALNLSRKNGVTILNRGSRVSCLPLLWERAAAVPRIQYHEQVLVSSVRENDSGGLLLACSGPAEQRKLSVDFLVGAIGREPQLDFMSSMLKTQADELEQQGKLYFIGDIKNDLFRQTSIAVGEGVLAAMKIYRQMEEKVI